MTANIPNQNQVETSQCNDASKALAINSAASSKIEAAGAMQKSRNHRESFLSALLRVFSSVAF